MNKKFTKICLHICGLLVFLTLELLIFAWGYGAKQPLLSICCIMTSIISCAVSTSLSTIGYNDLGFNIYLKCKNRLHNLLLEKK